MYKIHIASKEAKMYQKHSNTSKGAFKTNDFTTVRGKVLSIIDSRIWIGATAEYVALRMDKLPHTISPRIHELCLCGDVIKVKDPVKSLSGNDVSLYVSKNNWTPEMGRGEMKSRNSDIEDMARRLVIDLEVRDDFNCQLQSFRELKNLLGV